MGYNSQANFEKVTDAFLGQSIALVEKVKYRPTGEILVRKRYELHPSEEQRRKQKVTLSNEVEIMKKLAGYPFLVAWKGNFEYDDRDKATETYNIIITPVAKYNLHERLCKIRYELDPQKQLAQPSDLVQRNYCFLSIKWLKQLSNALAILHRFIKVRHRDLKPSNILLHNTKSDAEDDNVDESCLISDFGISFEFLERTSKTNTANPATGFYSAPEVYLTEANRGQASDVFSLGCIFFEILAVLWNKADLKRHTLICGSSTEYAKKNGAFFDAIDAISNEGDPPLLETQALEKRKLKDRLKLVRTMLNNDPDQRPTSGSIHECLVEISKAEYKQENH